MSRRVDPRSRSGREAPVNSPRRGGGTAALERVDGSAVDVADRELCATLDRQFKAAARRAGELLVCRAGCDACCRGPFPITRLDARRLRAGLDRLERDDPHAARAIHDRAARAVETLRDGFPGDPRSGSLCRDEAALDRFFERHAALDCPALAPDSGRCELYAARPVSCRTYGPPVRFGDVASPPCDLCFRNATPGEIEACRFAPDEEGLEEAILRAIGAQGPDDWETLVAFALVRPVQDRP